MKKIIASAGMVAVGATGLHAANYGDSSPDEAGKRWSVSAAVRGFYDDNYTTRPSRRDPVTGERLKRDSFGFEVSPSAALNLPMETSFLGLTYTYTLSYYEARDANKTDQSHDVALTFDHRFSERYHVNLHNQFVYSIEPTLVEQGQTITTPLRADAEVLHNRAVLGFDAQITPLWSVLVGYANNYYNYNDDRYSALLDRVEHLFRVEPRHHLAPNTLVFGGYQYGITDYLSEDFITDTTDFLEPDVRGTDRDNESHYAYVGTEHKFSSVLTVEGRVGVQFITYSELDQDDFSPYADIVGTYSYMPGSYVKLGVKQAHNATDVSGPSLNELTLDQDATTVFLSVRHRLTALLSGELFGQYQHSTYNGGIADGESDDYVSMGLRLAYKINRHFSAETGYSLDHLSSYDDARGFTRNRVFVGVRGTY